MTIIGVVMGGMRQNDVWKHEVELGKEDDERVFLMREETYKI